MAGPNKKERKKQHLSVRQARTKREKTNLLRRQRDQVGRVKDQLLNRPARVKDGDMLELHYIILDALQITNESEDSNNDDDDSIKDDDDSIKDKDGSPRGSKGIIEPPLTRSRATENLKSDNTRDQGSSREVTRTVAVAASSTAPWPTEAWQNQQEGPPTHQGWHVPQPLTINQGGLVKIGELVYRTLGVRAEEYTSEGNTGQGSSTQGVASVPDTWVEERSLPELTGRAPQATTVLPTQSTIAPYRSPPTDSYYFEDTYKY